MKPTLKTLAFLVPLLAAAPAVLAQGQRPEGNLGAGAAMGGAQSQSTGTAPGAAVPAPPTHSPHPAGAPDSQARQRPEGNLGAGAAMSGAQSQSMGGGSPSTGGTAVPQPSTTSPRR